MSFRIYRGVSSVVVACALWCVVAVAHGAESICAVVKIEISQQLTLERQAFDAKMRINNVLESVSLEDVNVSVWFQDENGAAVLATDDASDTSAKFYIRVSSLENINDVDGSGVVAPNTTAEAHWLIIPAPGAGGSVPSGTLYFVGATLTFNAGGDAKEIAVAPDDIYVRPMPRLRLDYFLPQLVFADDTDTVQIEPPVPFSLGLMVSNNGYGEAKSLKIDSAQPKILSNDQGLLIDFRLLGSYVADAAVNGGLLLDFGDIAPSSSRVGRWVMTTSLSGVFKEFTARFSHADELGGQLTSLIETAETHALIQDVLVDAPGRDSALDFLALTYFPDNTVVDYATQSSSSMAVYESDGTISSVTNQSSAVSLSFQQNTAAGTQYLWTQPATSGLVFAQIDDPFNGAKDVVSVMRSDGRVVPLQNIWFSKRQLPNLSWEYYLSLFDTGGSGVYHIIFQEGASHPTAPQIQFISAKSLAEEQSLGFYVQATDANGDAIVLTAINLPAGASFTDTGNGQGSFDWLPTQGQAGDYSVTFRASDGVLSSERMVQIKVNSLADSDGDGLPDAWELEHFGNLDQDGSGDFDGDGISNAEEYALGTNPDTKDGPSAPTSLTPSNGTVLQNPTPELGFTNAQRLTESVLTYQLEIFADEGYT